MSVGLIIALIVYAVGVLFGGIATIKVASRPSQAWGALTLSFFWPLFVLTYFQIGALVFLVSTVTGENLMTGIFASESEK